MTAQISDVFMYQGREFDLAGISDGQIFHPESLGIEPIGYSTCCYRGYQAVFAVADGRLVLHTLRASLYTEGPNRPEPLVGPAINGFPPRRDDEDHLFNNIYENIDYPLPYTGGLLLADDFISELYEHMGFHPPWKYRCVWELLFEDGRLTKAIDCSQRMADIRERMQQMQPEEFDDRDKTNELYAWIEKSFDRSY